MRFPPEFLERLRDEIQTSDVVSRKVNLTLKGKEYSGLCPFHQEKSPSFTVNNDKGFYHCFGCGAHGDIVKFTMETEGLSFYDSVVKLAEEFSIPVPRLEKEDKQKEDEYRKLYDVMELSCRIFEHNLYTPQGEKALKYLRGRGLTDEYIRKFRLGFAPDSFDYLINELKKQGVSEDLMLKAGLVSRNDRGKLYDKFRNRVMFTILDKRERVVAFSGRVLDDSKPKYMNSPETKLYHKGSLVYNYAFARKEAYDTKQVVAVEGNMDVISVYANGVQNVVAPMGTAVTQEQIKELWKIADEVIFCMDGDAAGIKATKRVSELVLPIILPQKMVKFVLMPAGDDPDTYIKQKGVISFKKLIKKAEPLSEFIWKSELGGLEKDGSNHVSPEEKTKLEAILNKKVALINDTAQRQYFLYFYRNKIRNLNKKIFKDSQNQANKNRFHGNREESDCFRQEAASQNILNAIKYERDIIGILVSHPELINYNPTDYPISEFHFYSEDLGAIRDIVLEISGDELDSILNKYNDVEELTSFDLEKLEEVKKNITEILEKEGFEYYIRYSRQYFNKKSIKALKYSLAILVHKHDLERIIEERGEVTKNEEIDVDRLFVLQRLENELQQKIKTLKSDLQFT